MPPVVLVIEPDRAVRQVVAAFLRDEPVELVAVSGHREAVAALEGATPDLILADFWDTPGAWERGERDLQDSWPGTPVIVLGGAGTREAETHPVLAKPFSREQLLEVVRKALDRR